MKAREKLANKKKPSKLHRGWHPGQRTRAPDPVEKKPAQTDKQQNELFSGRFLFKDDDGEDIWCDDGVMRRRRKRRMKTHKKTRSWNLCQR
jgi:hypothetical protein